MQCRSAAKYGLMAKNPNRGLKMGVTPKYFL
ncbi:Uncharacterised protein [Enterobacter cloacae]|nr:Uncharacterised protein [Enterobacter cloacae]